MKRIYLMCLRVLRWGADRLFRRPAVCYSESNGLGINSCSFLPLLDRQQHPVCRDAAGLENGSHYGTEKVPSEINSCIDDGRVNASLFRPLHNIHRNTIYRHIQIAAAIVGLCLSVSEANVPRLIVPVVVFAVDGQIRFIDVLDVFPEGREIVPSFTDFDPAPTIIIVVRISFVFTSTNHAVPDVVYSRVAHSVSTVSCGGKITTEASATLAFAASEVGMINAGFRPAIAFTEPLPALTYPGKFLDDQPATESLPGEIDHWTVSTYDVLSHVRSPLTNAVRALGEFTPRSGLALFILQWGRTVNA